MTDRRRVLLVSFFYPPDPAVGGLRIWNFARYLPKFGWDPVVLTSDRPQFGAAEEGEIPVYRARFFSFFEAVHPPDRPDGGGGAASGAPVSSMRDRALTPGWKGTLYRGVRHVLPMSVSRMPDATLGWVPDAVSTGARLLRDGSFDAIFSSHGPPSSHMVAASLARKSGLPWVADFRDLWSENHADPRISGFRAAERLLERRVVRRASALSTVSPPYVELLGVIHRKPVAAIFNGFEPDEFLHQDHDSHRFRILYVGTLHPHGQDVRPLMWALHRLGEEMSEEMTRAHFGIDFIGTTPDAILPVAEEYDVSRWVTVSPRLNRSDAMKLQCRATALLYLTWGGSQKGVVTAKLFEYLGAGRPILAVGPGGGPDEAILSECTTASPLSDPEAVATRLREWIGRFLEEGTLPSTTDPSAALAYTREAQTGHLAKLLDEVVAPRVGLRP